MHYEYTALNPANAILRGELAAWSKRAAAKKLRQEKLIIVTLRRLPSTRRWRNPLTRTVSTMDRILFTRNLMTMLKAGMNLLEALASSREQTNNQILKHVIFTCEQLIQSGQPLSSAFRKYPAVFSSEYIAIVTIGERSGKLVEVLEYLTKKMEDEYRLLRRIRQALTYPTIIFITMLLIVSIMVLFVIPKVSFIYHDAGVALPLLTRVLLQISTFLGRYFLPGFVVILAIGLIFNILLLRWIALRRLVDRAALHLPLFGIIIKKLNVAMVSRSLSMLLQAGITIDRALLLAGDTTRNLTYRYSLRAAEPLVSRGVHLADIFRGQPQLYLPVFQRMVSTGEVTGNLEHMLANVAKYYDDDLEYWAANISSTIEPVMIVSVAVVVAGIAVAILFPLWNLVNVIT